MIKLEEVKKAFEESEFRILDSTEYVTECQSKATGELVYLANKAGLNQPLSDTAAQTKFRRAV
jgi:hypothetical protein